MSGADGRFLWNFNDSTQNDVMNLYTGQFIPDRDQDGVPDILNIHGGDPLGEPGTYSGSFTLSEREHESQSEYFPSANEVAER